MTGVSPWPGEPGRPPATRPVSRTTAEAAGRPRLPAQRAERRLKPGIRRETGRNRAVLLAQRAETADRVSWGVNLLAQRVPPGTAQRVPPGTAQPPRSLGLRIGVRCGHHPLPGDRPGNIRTEALARE